jgi:hypothetical protein
MGSWPLHPEALRLNDRIKFQILKAIALPLGTPDVVEFDGGEIDALITLLFSTSIFGWSVNEDLYVVYVVPETGRYIAKTDHHGVIHVSFRSPAGMETFVHRATPRLLSVWQQNRPSGIQAPLSCPASLPSRPRHRSNH